MKMQNQFEVPMVPTQAWALLMNISETVPCFPGAELVETIDAGTYKGRVKVKLGPMLMMFAGTVFIENRDEAARAATIKANWSEAKGRGNAITVTHFSMQARDGGTVVVIDSDVQLAGQIAQYGRGAGMISEVSAELISQFAENLRAKIRGPAAATDAADPAVKPVPAVQTEISGFSLLWKVFMARIRRLFSR
jgi:carbon monoxide dehydrogenase subunit G